VAHDLSCRAEIHLGLLDQLETTVERPVPLADHRRYNKEPEINLGPAR